MLSIHLQYSTSGCRTRCTVFETPSDLLRSNTVESASAPLLITELAGQGVAVLMISSEMPEVLGMSDRILVMHEGRMTGIVDRKDANQVKIMELASQ